MKREKRSVILAPAGAVSCHEQSAFLAYCADGAEPSLNVEGLAVAVSTTWLHPCGVGAGIRNGVGAGVGRLVGEEVGLEEGAGLGAGVGAGEGGLGAAVGALITRTHS